MAGGAFRNPAGPCLFWAGVSIAGAVAAVSKFRVTEVPKPSLYKVGKEQFRALRRVEYLTAAAASLTAISGPDIVRPMVAVAVAVTGAQVFLTVPVLEARADAASASASSSPTPTSSSNAHRTHTVLELIKLTACVVAAAVAM